MASEKKFEIFLSSDKFILGCQKVYAIRTCHIVSFWQQSVQVTDDNSETEKLTIVKGQKNKIMTRQESQHYSRHNVFIAHRKIFKHLPTHIEHIAKAQQVSAKA